MWTKPLLISKTRALAIHLVLSALILIPFAILIAFYWFPAPLFFTDGGWQGLRIMLFVDMVIGPTLTFLVFNPSKSIRELTLDFSVIAMVQSAALTYGYINVDSQRPLAVVFNEGAFVAVSKDRLALQTVAPETWEALKPGPPYWVYVRKPSSYKEQIEWLKQSVNDKIMEHEIVASYAPLAAHLKDLAAVSKTPDDPPDFAEELQPILDKNGLTADQVLLLPLSGYYRAATLIFNREGTYLGAVYHADDSGSGD